MNPISEEMLMEYVLGELGDDDAREVKQAMGSDPSLAREIVALQEVLASIALLAPSMTPPPHLKDRLLREIESAHPFAAFAKRLAQMFDLSLQRMQEILHTVEDPKLWEITPIPGVSLFHFAPGPSLAGADAGFLRLEPGALFPKHLHPLGEKVMVVEGTMIDEDGTIYRPGDVDDKPPGSAHVFRAGPEGPLVGAALVLAPIEFVTPA